MNVCRHCGERIWRRERLWTPTPATGGYVCDHALAEGGLLHEPEEVKP